MTNIKLQVVKLLSLSSVSDEWMNKEIVPLHEIPSPDVPIGHGPQSKDSPSAEQVTPGKHGLDSQRFNGGLYSK